MCRLRGQGRDCCFRGRFFAKLLPLRQRGEAIDCPGERGVRYRRVGGERHNSRLYLGYILALVHICGYHAVCIGCIPTSAACYVIEYDWTSCHVAFAVAVHACVVGRPSHHLFAHRARMCVVTAPVLYH